MYVTLTIGSKQERKVSFKSHMYLSTFAKRPTHATVYNPFQHQIDERPLGSYGNNNPSNPPQIVIAPAM